VGVGGHAVDLDAQLLEFSVVVGQVFEFGRAHEGEVGGVEHENGPLALQVLVGDVDELAVLVGGGLERLDLRIDQGHCGTPNSVGGTGARGAHRPYATQSWGINKID